MRIVSIALTMLLLTGCQEGQGTSPSGLGSSSFPNPPVVPGRIEPSYGPVEEMTGMWEHGFEVSAFSPCSDDACSHFVPPEESCWLNGNRQFFDQVRAASTGAVRVDGHEKWTVRLKGRVARGGFFGHLGAHRCEVEGEQLLSMRPWAGGG